MSWFRSSWNLLCEISRLYKINRIITEIRNVPSNITEDALGRLRHLILEGGSIYIKFAQWIISHISYDETYSHIVEYFQDIFENCPSQSIEESNVIYQSATGHNLEEDIDFATLVEIGSGSIGTVYKAIAKNGKTIAIKIKHPQINRELEDKRTVLSILRRLQNIGFIRRYFNLCFDLDDFMNNIFMQTDFNIEAFNMEKMRKNFSDNKCVVIPRVIFAHENVLITEFEDTISLDELGTYEKHLVAINLVCIIYQMSLIDNFIHGDLHCKNWKVKRCPVNGNLQIVLFDTGICFNMDDVGIARLLWDSLEKGDSQQILECIRSMCVTEIPIQLTNELDSIVQNMSNNKIDIIEILSYLINYFSAHNLKVHPYAVNILIMVCLIQKFIKRNGFVQEENEFRNIFSIVQSSRMDIISYCECYKSFPEVCEMMREKLARCNPKKAVVKLKLSSPDEFDDEFDDGDDIAINN